jgi:dTMP kinase
MTADKQAQQHWFDELENLGIDYLILDRYTGSQDVYSIANGISPVWTAMLQIYMRMPDFEIFIDIPPEESMSRKGKHNNGLNDRYESDLNLLTKVRDLYLDRDNIVINGMQSIENIHFDIVKSFKSGIIE